MKIGFIGQGFVGKAYADDFENRGFEVVRYQRTGPLGENKEKIKTCDVVFIAVPTPTTPEGFNDRVVQSVVSLVGKGKIAVIKSTVLPGTTDNIQKRYPDRIILFSPEFLLEKTAAQDAAHPIMNILGKPADDAAHRRAAKKVSEILPKSPHSQVCTAREAEFIKYTHNCRAYTKIIMANIMFDLSSKLGCRWNEIKKAMDADPMFSNWYNTPVHQGGRGAGGHCFIKDFAAFVGMHKKHLKKDSHGFAFLDAAAQKNIELLRSTKKSLEILESVYGKNGR